MGVVQVAKSQRRLVSSGQVGRVKPSFQIADRSGEQQAGQAVASIAGGILNKVIQAQENEQVSTFEGAYDTEVVKFNGLIRANPGASEQQVKRWMQEANTNIDTAAKIPTNRNAQARVSNTIKRNVPAFNEQMEANWTAIESKRMMDNLNDEIEIAVQNLDKAEVERLVTEASGNLIDPEQKELLIKLKNLRIDRLSEGVARQAQADAERKMIDGQVDYINGLLHKERKAAVDSLTGIEQVVRNEIRARVERQMDVEMEAVELEARKLLLRETGGKADPDISGAKAIINDNYDNFGTDWHKAALADAQGVAIDLNETGINPYTTTQNWPRYYEDEDLARKGKLSLPTIQKHTGRNGYSDKEATRLKAIIKDPVGESDPILTDALAEVEDFANLERAALSKFVDSKGEPLPAEDRDIVRKERTEILRETNELKHQLRQIKIQNPEIRPGEYHKAIDDILTPKKQKSAADNVNKWWKIIRGPDIEPLTLGGGGIGGVGTIGGVVQRDNAKTEPKYETIAVNPETGERRGWDGKKWVIIP